MLNIDLNQGFGDFDNYKLFKFPDNSIKFELKNETKAFNSGTDIDPSQIRVSISLRNSEDLIVLGLVKSVIDNIYRACKMPTILYIKYMMYQQDDRLFKIQESFGLKYVCNLINSMNFTFVEIFHPHSDKVEFINNLEIIDNLGFIKTFLTKMDIDRIKEDHVWVVPDAGAFKTQFKQLEKLGIKNFITCSKSRDHASGEIETIVHTEDLTGKNCYIIDDICLGGRTFMNIAQELKNKNANDLELVVSHGIFNNGINHLLKFFKTIYTTDSICTLPESENLKIFKL